MKKPITTYQLFKVGVWFALGISLPVFGLGMKEPLASSRPGLCPTVIQFSM